MSATMKRDIGNLSAVKLAIGQRVVPDGFTKQNCGVGTIIGFCPPVGRSGEWSYIVKWSQVGEGSGWRDCDLKAI